jgi:hypothetical protein
MVASVPTPSLLSLLGPGSSPPDHQLGVFNVENKALAEVFADLGMELSRSELLSYELAAGVIHGD